ncbi:Glycosyl hydrolases 36 [Macleaya cordata]|uniref:Glycosyl hydrolases 36 n=1 Tax=Macleaya cordata TaxID=56857 RepID=A0A200QPL0_MACCD|nr:Glycosyl hydrolases 36 [Macleaya cordata]
MGVYWLQGVHMIHCADNSILEASLEHSIAKELNGIQSSQGSIKGYSQCFKPMSDSVHVNDIEWDQKTEASEMGDAEAYTVYLNLAEQHYSK